MGCLGSWRAFQSAKVIWYMFMRRFTLIGSRNARAERSPSMSGKSYRGGGTSLPGSRSLERWPRPEEMKAARDEPAPVAPALGADPNHARHDRVAGPEPP